MSMVETTEFITMNIPVEDARIIAGADVVEYQICKSEYVMHPNDKDGLNKVLNSLGAGA